MNIVLTAISLIAITYFVASMLPAYCQVETNVVKTTTTQTTTSPAVTEEILVTPGTVVVGPRLLGWSIASPSVDARRHELELRIAQDVVDNKISSGQQADFRKSIDELVALEGNLLQPKGFLTNEEARVLFTKYDRIGSRLDECIAVNKKSMM